MKKTGIRLVAATAGVSIGTVSKVLNPNPAINAMVSAETTAKVLAAVKKVDYRPSYCATLMHGQSTRTLGFVPLMPSDRDGVYMSGYAARILNGVGQVATAHGYQVLIIHSDEFRSFMDIRRVDAIAFVGFKLANNPEGRAMKAMFRHFNERGYAYAVINGNAGDVPVPRVEVDNAAAMALAAKLILRKGYPTVGFVGELAENPLEHHCERLKALRAALSGTAAKLLPKAVFNGPSNGLAAQPRDEGYSYRDGATALGKMAEAGTLPRCLVCGNDHIAIGVLSAARERGIRVPEDLAVIGFDDDVHTAFLSPSLTTLRQPLEDFGVRAAEYLMARIAKRDATLDLRVAPQLIERGSA
ncbi:MAG: LacI family DNA-binding transcriptional regulator [Planctomycetes bacterium]|nr:LacI family DNA-binding transcriptional regulator [Planctomycetota bacterium]